MNHFIFVADRNWSKAMGDLDSLPYSWIRLDKIGEYTTIALSSVQAILVYFDSLIQIWLKYVAIPLKPL